MKKKILLLFLLLFPIQVFAYSNEIYVSGEPIGIEIHAKGVYVIDFYKVNNKTLAEKSGLKIGDIILEVNHQKIETIDDLNHAITSPGVIPIKIDRKGEIIELELKSELENNQIKTGMYVKDAINGIGTLSYIDPETKIYASLGHEILESNSNQIFNCKNGYIFDADLNYIHKSEDGKIGEVHANFHNTILGVIEKNEINGIYGKYMADITDSKRKIEVGKVTDIKKGEASILLTLDNKEEQEYKINIIAINESSPVKNIHFEITDKELIEKTGGVVQGMSGAPILQNNKIIGVVNYVIVNDSKKGYGIFIEKMLEEGDKLLQK